MEKTTRYAHIPEIKTGLVFSDPLYNETVWCQHRSQFQAKDWYMKLETSRNEDNYIDITLFLGRPSLMTQLTVEKNEDQEECISYPSYCKSNTIELGIDTAKIFVGTLDNFEDWAEEGAIRTGADGMFGGLLEFTCKHEDTPAGYVLLSELDSQITDEEDLFHTLLASFDAKELSAEIYNVRTNSLGVKAMIAHEYKAAKSAEEKQGTTPLQEKPDPER